MKDECAQHETDNSELELYFTRSDTSSAAPSVKGNDVLELDLPRVFVFVIWKIAGCSRQWKEKGITKAGTYFTIAD